MILKLRNIFKYFQNVAPSLKIKLTCQTPKSDEFF